MASPAAPDFIPKAVASEERNAAMPAAPWRGLARTAKLPASTNELEGERMAAPDRRYHNSDRVHQTARGRPRPVFPHAVSTAGGRTVHVAGQLAWAPDGTLVGKGDMAAQYAQVCENIKAVLEDLGGSLDDVVKITTFLTDMDAYQSCIPVRETYLGKAWPVSTTVEVTRLAHPDCMVEIEAVAVIGE